MTALFDLPLVFKVCVLIAVGILSIAAVASAILREPDDEESL
jgi:hypothetical protein